MFQKKWTSEVDCPANKTCKGRLNKRFIASMMNNVSFVRPSVSLLESHYHKIETEFSSDFPEKPPHEFNYTGVDPSKENLNTNLEVAYGTRLEIVLQDTNLMNPQNHPIHVHGHNFFIVGTGFGNFNAAKDTIWLILRRGTRWLCRWGDGRRLGSKPIIQECGLCIVIYIEEHTSWGLAMGFIVKSGNDPSQSLLPPPADLPPC